MLLPLWLCAAGMAGAAGEARQGRVELTLPRATAPGEEAWLRIHLGTLPRGAKVRISTSGGAPVGTVSPFGAEAARSGGAYTVPLPKGAVTGGRVSLRIEVIDAAGVVRAPAASEVESIELINVPVSR